MGWKIRSSLCGDVQVVVSYMILQLIAYQIKVKNVEIQMWESVSYV